MCFGCGIYGCGNESHEETERDDDLLIDETCELCGDLLALGEVDLCENCAAEEEAGDDFEDEIAEDDYDE